MKFEDGGKIKIWYRSAASKLETVERKDQIEWVRTLRYRAVRANVGSTGINRANLHTLHSQYVEPRMGERTVRRQMVKFEYYCIVLSALRKIYILQRRGKFVVQVDIHAWLNVRVHRTRDLGGQSRPPCLIDVEKTNRVSFKAADVHEPR